MNFQSYKVQTALNVVTGLFAVVVQFAVSFFLSPFIVRTLGAEANGFSQLANNFVMYASLLTIAFNSMAARFVSVAYHQNEFDRANKLYSSIFIVDVLICILLLPISALIIFNLEHVVVIENADVLDVKVLFACVFLNFFMSLVMSLFSLAMYVKNKVFYSNLLNAVKAILNATLLLVVFSVFPAKIFYISMVASLLTMMMLPIYRRLQARLLPEVCFQYKNFSFLYVKELLSSGIWNTVNQCGHLLNTGLDLLLANWFISPFSMGLLAISKIIPSAIIQLSTTLNGNFSPSVTQTWAKGNREALLRELRIAMKVSTIIVSVPIVTFCCFGYDFYKLWQPTLPATELTVISILGCMAFIPVSGTQTLYNVFTATNKLRVNSISFIFMGLLNVLVVFLGLTYSKEYGIYVIAGCSTTLSIFRNMIVTLPYTAYLLNMKWFEFYKDVLQTLLCCSINVFISLLFVFVFHLEGWLGLFIMCGLTVVFTLLIDIYYYLNKNERDILFKILKIRKNNG